MAMSVTITEEVLTTVKKVKASVVSAGDGSASGETTLTYSGEILRMAIVPGSGATQPSNDFDLEVLDEDDLDIVAGQGANLSNAAATTVVASMGAVANDKMTFSLTNMGGSKTADIYLYLR
jgi:hypothetical protein